MRIALFGGSFNPPHIAHLIVAEVACDQFEFDAVWWIPNATPPHKTNDHLAPASDRLAMTRAAVADHEGFSVCNIEIERPGVSYTVDTVRALTEQHPEASFSLLIGSDSLDTFHTWREPDTIAELADLVVYKRPGGLGDVAAPRFANCARYVAAPMLEVSSTEVRQRCYDGRSIRYMVPAAVRSYIRTHGLYVPNP
ncbi:MAG: nicotinate (nicotinamide) nucleotide adenylyltransferase [Longimonas sp.]|uniref:nicotinate (nicotinamide) nucleotide adenylyltransferase n=1 Tax=Longimonas sp. TaxID=2039626 RepID=UPI0039762835